MTRMLLTLSEDVAAAATDYDEVFLWTKASRCSFTGDLDPYLRKLGPVGALNADLVRIALAVLAADRSLRRESRGSKWNTRSFELVVEVIKPEAWRPLSARLAGIVGFLSGDHWEFEFSQGHEDDVVALAVDEAPSYERTVLLSGGADSATGALMSALDLEAGTSQALVSQYSLTALSPIQQGLVSDMRLLAPQVEQRHYQLHLSRGTRRLDGSSFKNEKSTRSRSLLFLSLGLAVAQRAGTPLLVPENGFASLNPPLGPDRRGSLSTRTTHPKFLADLSDLLREVGAHHEIVNPFAKFTKGEMFRALADRVGAPAASDYLSATNSCAHTDGHYSGASPGSSCGVCFGCLIRRASFAAANIEDKTAYLCNDADGKFDRFVQKKSIVEPMRDFALKGVPRQAIMSMSLPSGYPARDAFDICQRGVSEIRGFLE